MPMTLPVGEAESNPIMIAVMDAKSITAIVVLVRMGMAATPPHHLHARRQTLLDTVHRCAAKGCRLHPHIHRQSLENHNYYVAKHF